MNKKLRTGLIAVMLLLVKTALPAADYSVSISPLTLLEMLVVGAIGGEQDEQGRLALSGLDVDFNLLLDDNKEQSIGMYLMSGFYGLRYQFRSYAGEDHAGFLYGMFAKLEYRIMEWSLNDGDWLFGGGRGGAVFHSAGLTAGADIGFRLRGERWGATFFAGAGLPLFYCFGDLPEKEDRDQFYLLNALMWAFELGFKIDIYL
jgi:hypothetical protein